MSRYLERAIAVVRLIDVTWQLELDASNPDEDEEDFWAPLLMPVREGGFVTLGPETETTPRSVRHCLAFDSDNPNSLVSCIQRARSSARGVRESISSEMWEHINTLYLSLVDPRLSTEAEEDPATFYRRVREGAQFIQGLADCTLAHDEPWHFFSLGKFLERADNVARVLSLQAHLLASAQGSPGGDDMVRWLAVLRSCGSAEAYARFYSLRVDPARVVEFLVLNPIFPQSVRFCLGAAWDSLKAIADQRASSFGPSPAVRALGLLRAKLEHAEVDEVLEEGLKPYLADVQYRIALVSEHVTRSYLLAEPQPGRLVASSRAAMIMAAQQQQ